MSTFDILSVTFTPSARPKPHTIWGCIRPRAQATGGHPPIEHADADETEARWQAMRAKDDEPGVGVEHREERRANGG